MSKCTKFQYVSHQQAAKAACIQMMDKVPKSRALAYIQIATLRIHKYNKLKKMLYYNDVSSLWKCFKCASTLYISCKEVLAIRHIFSLVDMIINTKFSNALMFLNLV